MSGLAYSEAPAVLKISAKPSPESTSMFSALKEMKAGIASMEKFGEPSVPDILCGHGVDEKVKPLIVVLKTKFAEWSSDFSNKIGEQSQKMAETFPGHFNIQQLQSSPTESPGRSVAFPGFRSPSQLPGEAIPKGEAMTSWDL